MIDRNYRYFVKSLFWIFGFILLGVLLFFLSRIAYLISFGDFDELSNYRWDVVRAFFVGIRFDIKVLTIGLLPLILIPLITLFIGKRFFNVFRRIIGFYGILVACIYAFLMVIDFYFYSFYNTRISIIIFGFFEDDTLAVIKTLWTDFPLIAIILGMALLVFIMIKIGNWLVKEREFHSLYFRNILLQLPSILLVLVLYFLGMRGTVSMKPLDGRHATISENTFVNTLCNNSVFSLKTAFSDRKESSISTNSEAMLHQLGFHSANQAIAIHLGRPIADTLGVGHLLETTPTNTHLATQPPSVVFILMEGLSNFYLNLHSSRSNLLGALESQLNECYVFRNFLPAFNGTIYSLENLLVGTPQSPLSQSPFQTFTLESSVAKPFVQQGYATTFITGGKMGWRSMDKFVGKQYFNVVESEPSLLKRYPKARSGEWGVHDQHLFDRIFSILEGSDGKPQFVFAMTISHHSPYDIPNDYEGYPLSIPEQVKNKLKTSEEVALRSFKAYQYANNCLGSFIERVRNSPLGENTIIVATGDHNVLQLIDCADRDLLWKYSVPLIMYVPNGYKPANPVNTSTFASHKDIFPTIFNIALSGAEYLKTGSNILSNHEGHSFGLFRYCIAMDSIGCIDYSSTPPLVFRWNQTGTHLEPSKNSPDEHLQGLMLKAKAYTAASNLFVMNDINKKKGAGVAAQIGTDN